MVLRIVREFIHVIHVSCRLSPPLRPSIASRSTPKRFYTGVFAQGMELGGGGVIRDCNGHLDSLMETRGVSQ